MNPNLSTSYVALQADRSRLSTQAERGWQAKQATVSESRRSAIAVTRQWAGVRLSLAVGRLRRAPRGTRIQAT
ncbi:MAG: hypothetical protein M3457_07155 [Chloroflexota bacterium]|nr:hypothetical protein [Chloroflexota bacterium]